LHSYEPNELHFVGDAMRAAAAQSDTSTAAQIVEQNEGEAVNSRLIYAGVILWYFTMMVLGAVSITALLFRVYQLAAAYVLLILVVLPFCWSPRLPPPRQVAPPAPH